MASRVTSWLFSDRTPALQDCGETSEKISEWCVGVRAAQGRSRSRWEGEGNQWGKGGEPNFWELKFRVLKGYYRFTTG